MRGVVPARRRLLHSYLEELELTFTKNRLRRIIARYRVLLSNPAPSGTDVSGGSWLASLSWLP